MICSLLIGKQERLKATITYRHMNNIIYPGCAVSPYERRRMCLKK
jgi:hypothetical protein